MGALAGDVLGTANKATTAKHRQERNDDQGRARSSFRSRRCFAAIASFAVEKPTLARNA
jgi:hypothetical protein